MALFGFLALLALIALGVLGMAWRFHMMTTDGEEYRRLKEIEREWKEGRNQAIGKTLKRVAEIGKGFFKKGGEQ
jgi:hypothetical protein